MMKRYILGLLIVAGVLFTQTMNATHLLGGSITYKCVGNNKVVFTLTVYSDCNGLAVNTSPKVLTGNYGSVTTNFVSQREIGSDACKDTTAIVCGQAFGAIREYIFQSDPFSLSGIPPATGWRFEWTDCCRPASITNLTGSTSSFFINTTIFPYYPPGSSIAASWTGACLDSSPDFLDVAPRLAMISTPTTVPSFVFDPESDSIFAQLAPSPTGSTSNASYATGYTWNNPLPSGSGSQGISLDANTGNYSFSSAVAGGYSVCIKYQAFRAGNRISEVVFELPVFVLNLSLNAGLCSSTAQPTTVGVQISPDSNLVTATGLTPLTITSGDTLAYEVSLSVGDTFKIEVEGTDIGLHPDCISQSVVIDVRAQHVADSLGNCQTGPCLEVISGNSNGTLTNVYNSKATLFWVPSLAQYLEYNKGRSYDIFIKVRDDWCPLPNAEYRTIRIMLDDPLPQLPDTRTQCVSEGAIGYTEFSWVPNVDTGDGFLGYVIRRMDTIANTIQILDTISDWSANVYTDSTVQFSSSFGYAVDVLGVQNKWRKSPEAQYPITLTATSTISFGQTELLWTLPHSTRLGFEVEARVGNAMRLTVVDSLLTYEKTIFGCLDTVIYRVKEGNSCWSNEVKVFEQDTVTPQRTAAFWATVDSANRAILYYHTVPDAIGYAILEGQAGSYTYIDTTNSVNDSIDEVVCSGSQPSLGSMQYLIQPFDSCGNFISTDTSLAYASLYLSVNRSTQNNTFEFSLIGLPPQVSAGSIALYERNIAANLVTQLMTFANGPITIPIPVDTLNKQYFAFGSGVGKKSLDIQSNTQNFESNIGIEQQGEVFKMYPNPSSDQVIFSGLPPNSRVSIFSPIGKKVMDVRFLDTRGVIRTDHLPSGTYWVRLEVKGGGVETKKLLLIQ